MVPLAPGRHVDLLEATPGGGLWILSHTNGDAEESTFFAQRLDEDLSVQCEANVGAFYHGRVNYGVAPDRALAFGVSSAGDNGNVKFTAVRFDPTTCQKTDWFVDPDFIYYSVNLWGPFAVSDTAVFFSGGYGQQGAEFFVDVADGKGAAKSRWVEIMPDHEDIGIRNLGSPARLANGTIVYTFRVPALDSDEIRTVFVDPKTARPAASDDHSVKLPTPRSAFDATILPQPTGGLLTVISSMQKTSDSRFPVPGYLDVLAFDLADDDPVAAWANTALAYPAANGTVLPNLDSSYVIGQDGWIAAGLDGRSALGGAFSVNYAALRFVETPSADPRTLVVDVSTDVTSVRLGSSARSWVTHAVRTESGSVVVSVWTSTDSNRIAGEEHEFAAGQGGEVLVVASSPSAFRKVPSADAVASTCAMMSDACLACVTQNVKEGACLGVDAVCSGMFRVAPSCGCDAQNANPDDSGAVDACFSALSNENAAGKLTAAAVLDTCGDVCR